LDLEYFNPITLVGHSSRPPQPCAPGKYLTYPA
jgi:hypothetical protein